ncbi:tetratricopeptide repeat protein [Akkermansiaceae bacterium]|nr:tetratricopeptide repeat protein [Akkermansiaceae bacterium]
MNALVTRYRSSNIFLMRLYFLFLSIVSTGVVFAQIPLRENDPRAKEAPLVSNPAQDQFEFCKQLYRLANSIQGDRYRSREAYQRVIPRLESYLERFPNDKNVAPAMYYLGECNYYSGAIEEARAVFIRTVNKFRKGRYVSLSSNRLARDAYVNEKYAEAAVYFGKVAEMASTPDERYVGRYQQAKAYLQANNKNGAIKSFAAIAKAGDAKDSYRESAKVQLGNLYYQKKDFGKSMEYFEELMLSASNPANKSEATFHVGLISMEQGDNKTAQSSFREVMSSNQIKFKPNAQTAIVRSLYKEGKYDEILKVMQAGNYLGTPVMESEKYALAGHSAYKLKRYQVAISHFATAERQVPLSDHAFDAAYFRLLCFYYIKGANIPDQVDSFLELYQNKHGKHKRIHKALLAKAETLFEQGKFDEASAAYKQIDIDLIDEKNQADLYYKRGCSLSSSEDHNRAVRNFTNFINRYSEDLRAPAAIARRGSSFLLIGDRASALSDFDLLIKKYPNDNLASLALQQSAKIKKDDKDYPEMIRRYSLLIEQFPALRNSTRANAEYWMGWGNHKLKEYEKAIGHLQMAAKLEPDKYAANAGLLIVYSSYALQDKTGLQVSINKMIALDQAEKIPIPIYRWVGLECFKVEQFANAETYLTLGTTPNEPTDTPTSYWKMLGSARVKTKKYHGALVSIKNFLDVEKEPFWRAEAYYDQSLAYLGINELDEAKNSAEASLKIGPKGTLNAEVRIVLGDIAYEKKEYAEAAAFYVVVVQLFVDDTELRPEALYKAHLALSKKGDTKQAEHYLSLLSTEFPNYVEQN